jgi:amidohydrolase
MRRILFSIFGLIVFINAGAQKDLIKTRMAIAAASDKIEATCIAWRRDFHQHPELGNRELRTQKIVADHLRSLGLEVKLMAKTGVVGILRGSKPGPCIALRTDMDALPLAERVKLDFASKEMADYNGNRVPVMHACGHDGHMAIMMSVAQILSGMKDQLNGTVKFIFQPAEEGPPEGEEGGAPLLVKEGVMEDPKVDAIFGLHLQPDIEVGKIAYKSGAFMAASVWFHLVVTGKGAHGSTPWLGIDPIQVSAQIIEAFQSIVARQMPLTTAPAVITIGKIVGGSRNNIIPDDCTMDGTIRTLDKVMQHDIQDRMKLAAENIAAASGAKAVISFSEKTLVTYNDPQLVKQMLPSLEASIGKENVYEREWTTNAEDFSFYGTKAPAFFFDLGGMAKGADPKKAPGKHTSDYYIDESCMKTGVRAFCNIVIDYLNQSASK